MKKVVRARFVALICIVAFLASFTVKAEQTTYINQPRYTELEHLLSDLGISETGSASCYARAHISDTSYTIELSMQLQRTSMTGDDWTNVRVPWTTTGNGTVYLEQVRFVTSGYFYRVLATATVYDENGNLIEEQTVSSEVVEY